MPQQIINIGTSPDSGDGDTVRVAFDKVNQNFTEVYGVVDDLSDEIIDKDIVGSVYSADNSTVMVDSQNFSIATGNLDISGSIDGDLVPSQDLTYSIGTPEKQWKALYLSGSTIFIDGIPVSIDNEGNLKVNDTIVLSLDNWEELIKQEILNVVNLTVQEIDGGVY